jgi:hypothetical protein
MKKFQVLIGVLFLIWVNYFYLVPSVPNRNQIISVLLILFFLMVMGKKIFKNYNYLFINSIIFFVFLYIQQIMISYIKYGQKFTDIITISIYNLIPLAYFLFAYFLKKTKNLTKFENLFIVFTTILSGLFIVQYYLFSKGIFFLSISHNIRFDSLRIMESAIFINIGTILAFSNMFNKNNNISFRISMFASFIIGLIVIIFIQKTRVALLLVLISLISILLFKNRKHISRSLFSIVVICIALILAIQLPFIQEYINSFSNNDYSYTARKYALHYYLSQVKENILYGMGFIKPIFGDESLYLLRGYDGIYSRDDVGIIGFLNSFGLIGTVWYIFLLLKVLAALFKMARQDYIDSHLELVGMVVYISFSSFTIIIMDPQRIVILPFFLAIFDYVYSCYQK